MALSLWNKNTSSNSYFKVLPLAYRVTRNKVHQLLANFYYILKSISFKYLMSLDIHYEVQRYLRWLEPWLMTHSWPSVFLKEKVLMYSPQLPYWDIRVSQTTFTQLEQLWRNEQIMPAPRRSPIQVLTQPSVA